MELNRITKIHNYGFGFRLTTILKSIPGLWNAFFILPCIITGLIIFTGTESANAQNDDDFKLKIPVFNEKKNPDIRDLLNPADSVKKDSKPVKFRMTKSPMTAVLYSALLPGLGQFYNKSYWKIPLIALIGGYFGYEIVKNNNDFLSYRDLYESSQTTANPSGNQLLKTYREFYRDQRDQFILYFGIMYLINLADAYVDAHLFDFDVSDKVRLGLTGTDNNIGLKINF